MAVQKLSMGRIVKIAIWCLIVGVILSALGVTPGDFWNSLWEAANRIYNWGISAFGWAWDFIVIGAAIVIPIILIRTAWRAFRSR